GGPESRLRVRDETLKLGGTSPFGLTQCTEQRSLRRGNEASQAPIYSIRCYESEGVGSYVKQCWWQYDFRSNQTLVVLCEPTALLAV
ncbi:hypothetical protein HAX54_002126, partial [Datura stramonium]|nr:hypothetical protein [Datura stramonium]